MYSGIRCVLHQSMRLRRELGVDTQPAYHLPSHEPLACGTFLHLMWYEGPDLELS